MTQEFVGETIAYRDDPLNRRISDESYVNCTLRNWSIGVGERVLIERVNITNSHASNLQLGASVLRNVVINGLQVERFPRERHRSHESSTISMLETNAALFDEVTLKGKIGPISLRRRVVGGNPALQAQRDSEERRFYGLIQGKALRIGEAIFMSRDVEIEVPGELVEIDSRHQMRVTPEEAGFLLANAPRLGFPGYFSLLRRTVDSGKTGILVAPKGANTYISDLSDIRQMQGLLGHTIGRGDTLGPTDHSTQGR